MKILLVEDEKRVADFIERGLKAEGHVVTTVDEAQQVLKRARRANFDVIILDLRLPDGSGLDVCRGLRTSGVHTPVLILTALDSTDDKVGGLRSGADDYMTKPFHFDELLARIEVLGRRKVDLKSESSVLRVGDLEFDRDKIEVKRGERVLQLTKKELSILEMLMSAPGKVHSRQRILSQAWGLSEDPLTNIVDVYIARLRKQIDRSGEPPMIETVRGQGYRILSPQQ